jgi:hypothetical protein
MYVRMTHTLINHWITYEYSINPKEGSYENYLINHPEARMKS